MAIYQSFTDTEIVAMGKKGNELDVIPALEEVTVRWKKWTLEHSYTQRSLGEPRWVSLNLAPGSLGELSNGGDLDSFQISRAGLVDKGR